MGRYLHKIMTLLILVFSWTVFICSPAKAYVLSGPHVLELMITKYGEARRLRVTQTWRLPAPQPPPAELESQPADTEPGAADIKLQAAEAEQSAAEGAPSGTAAEPRAAEAEPPGIAAETRAAEAEAPGTGGEPKAVEAEQPGIEAEPNAVEAEPGVVGAEPLGTEAEPGAAAVEPKFIEIQETLCYLFPQTFRSERHSPGGERIQVLTGSDALTAVDGRIVQAPADDFDCYKDLLLYRSREALQEKLTLLGVNANQSSLGRFEDKIAFVLGAQYPDESCPQVWIDKEDFRPLRWLFQKRTPAGELVGLEIRYRNWQSFAGNWYPLQITFLENGQVVKTLTVEKVEVDPVISSRLFDIDRLRRNLQPALPPGQEPFGSEGIGHVR